MAELKDKTAAHEHEHTHDHDHDHNHDHNHDHDHDHDHEHEHTHDHDHDHGHDHDHDHDHEEVELDESKMDAHHIICAECDEPMDECECPPDPKGVTQKIYDIKGLDCADCASKIERGLSKIEGIEDVSVVYATEQVRIRAEQPDRFLNIVNEVADKLEPGCVVCQRERSVAKARAAKVEEKKPFLKEWFFGEAYAKHQMIIGGILFVIGLILEHFMGNEAIAIPMYFIAYFFVGAPIVLTAIRMIFKGQFFDENFLMSVATIGAFCIQEYPEAVGVMLFYRIGEYFEEMASDRSRDQIMEAADMRPEVVNLVNENGEVEVIPSENAQVGDLVIVRPGDRVPLDGIVTEGESRIDTSPVTGEPVPVKVQVGDEVVSGCVNTSGTLTVRVEKPLEESMVTRILDSVENAAATKPKMDRFITRFSRVYTPFVVVVALLTAIVPPLFFGGDWYKWIYTALSFLVISCPCALVLSVPLAYFSGIGAGSKLGILFKGGISLEALNNVKAVVMDKTGTITKGNFVVQHIVSTSGMADDELLAVCAACEKFST
ncbi:MAG: heavy metal translocating P-type ATPase, partial [Eubacteriaceae bacterium]|nr:heavy metal translocating P-type ATPase [Eubacteriaceae bacterium]